MTDLLYDTAWNPPSPTAASRVGYRGALRYLSTDPTKNLTIPERDELRANGMSIGLVWETLANPLGVDPVWAGRLANLQAGDLRAPAPAAIYYAFDYDVPRSDWDPGERWLRAATNPAHPTGVYGPRLFIEEMLRRGAARYAWQAGGSSSWEGGANGTVSQVAHLYQRLTPTLPNPGGSVDENAVLQPDWGGWMPNVPPPPPTPASVPPPPIVVPPPKVVAMFIDEKLGVMKTTFVQCAVGGGSGWTLTDIPFGSLVSVMKQGAAPQRDGAYWTGEVSVNNTGEKVELSFTECKIGIPGKEVVEDGLVGVYVVTAG